MSGEWTVPPCPTWGERHRWQPDLMGFATCEECGEIDLWDEDGGS